MKNNFDVKEVQAKLLEMGKSIADILSAHNIPYMITFGTLLGAVRHGGFIPWDDDFDFYLFADTYDKALKILKKELPPDFIVEDEENEPLYFHGWAHVKDLYSEVYCEEFPQDNIYSHHGISVDLYKATEMKECELEDFIVNEHIAYLSRKLKHELISKVDYDKKVNMLRGNLAKQEKSISNKKLYGLPCKEKRMEYDDVMPLKKYKFEGYEFWGPNNYDNILKSFYGDYLTLPPEKDRTTHYSYVKFLDK